MYARTMANRLRQSIDSLLPRAPSDSFGTGPSAQMFVRARPNSFDGCRLAARLASLGVQDRVKPDSIPVMQLEEAQQSMRDSPDQPFVLQGAMESWAARNWDLEQLKREHGNVHVPVERSLGGGDYRDMYMPRSPAASPRSFNADVPVPFGELLDHVQHHRDDRKARTMCLAQHDLFELIPALADGIQEPPFPEAMARLHRRNAWLGPEGTTTPLHRDPYFNLLCQVWGEKHVQLFSPDWSQHLYPFATPFLRNSSQVDVANVDPAVYPLFMRVPYQECVLQPGDMLYIPRRWWHFVTARNPARASEADGKPQPSLSVNFWWT